VRVVPGRLRRLLPLACALATVFGVAGMARPAGAAGPGAPGASAQTPAGSPGLCATDDRQPLEAALARLPDCQDNPGWLAWVGDRLNRAGRHAEALEHLERALLLEPGLAPAQLGYLLALAGSGDIEAALAFAQDLLAGGSLPPAVAGPLAQRVARWQQALSQPLPVAPTERTRLSVGARAGYDSNLLGAPNLDSLTLILAGQPVELPLDASYRSRTGSYLRMDTTADHSRLLDHVAPGLRVDIGAQLRRRVSPQVPLSNLSQGQLAVELSQRWPEGPAASPASPGQPGGLAPLWAGWYASASAAALDSGTGTRYRSQGMGAGLQWRLAALGAPCEARSGAELQQRSLASNPVLSGRYEGALLVLQCEVPALGAQPVPGGPPAAPAWQLQLARGTDQPVDPTRPGGSQRQSLLRLTGLYGAWLADLEAERRTDATTYSLLLGEDTREILRRAARVEWRRMLPAPAWAGLPAGGPGAAGTALELRLGVEWSSQRANLGLFAARGWGPYLVLRYLW
jgi:hypothetical protein